MSLRSLESKGFPMMDYLLVPKGDEYKVWTFDILSTDEL